ncbi:helix-turn-helix domain-containing protein [Streptomyces hesseae]|uniref:Helix-turn-helix transcriptional regulator n=1 Tax=Streptomyces hesseae TaxID=3075519 RepID=A0ABU2SRR3_9ACTN|nr:helix-turn-helix transcriptional regulator [Streptomyces sp. DSM 40473]MDT0450599.1 helix-turn-helix transcriptional regulator [Streptomyces sp. DSM 40473]
MEHPSDEDESARGTLAIELRRLREQSGKSLAQLSEDTTYDRTYLHRLETGERLSQRPVMEALDAVYKTGGLLTRLWRLARQEAFIDRFKQFMLLEAKAVIMHKFMMAMPGLLQTEDYARVVLSSEPKPGGDNEVEDQVAARIGRQDLLHRDPPPNVRIILDEGVLRRPSADRKIWRDQLERIADSASSPHMTIQVLPFAAGVHDLMGGSLSLLWLPDGHALAYLEGSKSGELVDDPHEVSQLRLSYDRVRDLALPPPESLAFIQHVMEDNAP